MQNFNGLKTAFDLLLEDLPWGEKVRLVVGPLCSREIVKDALLKQTPIIPGNSVTGLAEVANEILASQNIVLEKPLSVVSQIDAVQQMAAQPTIQEMLPQFSKHLKTRKVAQKTAKFLTGLDRFYAND